MTDERYTTTEKTTTTAIENEARHDANRDPVTGEPGAHPVGTGVGAAGGATAGAALGGAVGGPVGAMIGAAVGGIAGGLAGKGVAEAVNPTEEDAFWRENYKTRPYAGDRSYDTDLRPAYQYGWESRSRHGNRTWNDAERDLESGWGTAKSSSNLGWNEAKHATRDAWERVGERWGTSGVSNMGLEAATTTNGVSTGNYDSTAAATGVGVTTSRFGESEDAYWRQTYSTKPYVQSGRDYDEYRPAYQYGYDSAGLHRGRRWDEVENNLEQGWERAKGNSRLMWHEVKDAVRDGWHRVERALPGDSDRDGR